MTACQSLIIIIIFFPSMKDFFYFISPIWLETDLIYSPLFPEWNEITSPLRFNFILWHDFVAVFFCCHFRPATDVVISTARKKFQAVLRGNPEAYFFSFFLLFFPPPPLNMSSLSVLKRKPISPQICQFCLTSSVSRVPFRGWHIEVQNQPRGNNHCHSLFDVIISLDSGPPQRPGSVHAEGCHFLLGSTSAFSIHGAGAGPLPSFLPSALVLQSWTSEYCLPPLPLLLQTPATSPTPVPAYKSGYKLWKRAGVKSLLKWAPCLWGENPEPLSCIEMGAFSQESHKAHSS